jgi:hypothetical protein
VDRLIVEYIAGFAFGLLIFQSLFMRDMMGGSYMRALRMSFMPEWLSMNMAMAGMIPVMVAGMMGRDMRAMEPEQLLYWGVMSAGVIVAHAVAYPVNWWLVAKGLKHGMGTDRALGKGGHSMEAERRRIEGLRRDEPDAHASRIPAQPSGEHAGHGGQTPQEPDAGQATMGHTGHAGSGAGGAFAVTRPQLFAVTTLTVLSLAGASFWASSYANLTLSARDAAGSSWLPG